MPAPRAASGAAPWAAPGAALWPAPRAAPEAALWPAPRAAPEAALWPAPEAAPWAASGAAPWPAPWPAPEAAPGAAPEAAPGPIIAALCAGCPRRPTTARISAGSTLRRLAASGIRINDVMTIPNATAYSTAATRNANAMIKSNQYQYPGIIRRNTTVADWPVITAMESRDNSAKMRSPVFVNVIVVPPVFFCPVHSAKIH